MKKKDESEDNGCRRGCKAVEDAYHVFIVCKAYLTLRRNAVEEVIKRTKSRIEEKGLEESKFSALLKAAKSLFSDNQDIWPLHYSFYYLGHVPPLNALVPESHFESRISCERFLHNVHTDWHLIAVRLASRIYGQLQKEMARRRELNA